MASGHKNVAVALSALLLLPLMLSSPASARHLSPLIRPPPPPATARADGLPPALWLAPVGVPEPITPWPQTEAAAAVEQGRLPGDAVGTAGRLALEIDELIAAIKSAEGDA
ncbi:hypothetical protein ACP70R_032151 [Stipagrostis hirtigluma subsp. patula]